MRGVIAGAMFVFAVTLLAGAAQAQSAGADAEESSEAASAALTPQQKQQQEAAKAAYKEAAKAASEGKLEEALVLYQKADQTVPAPAPKFKVAVTLDKLERFAEAQVAYEAFLELKPDPDKFFSKIESARDRLRAFLAMPATIKVTTNPAAPPNLVIAVDRLPQSGTEIIVLPGMHTLSAVADGFTGSKSVMVRAAAKMEVEIELVPERAAPAVAPSPVVASSAAPMVIVRDAPSRHEARTAAYFAFGLAGVQAIVGGIFTMQALQAKDTYDNDPTLEHKFDIDRSAAFADAFFATALTSIVGGVVLLIIDPADPPKTASSEKRP